MKTKFHLYLTIFAIFAFMVIPTITFAASTSPFIGHWQAIDVDGSDIRLAIAGPPQGPFQITWMESYISFCNREPGIVRGTGWLNEGDSNLLEADLHLECFTTGAMLDFQLTFRYHPASGTLSSKYSTGQVIIWHHPGGGQVVEPPALGLRVNYGHDWVESFYEGGHTAWVTLTESDGVTVKGTIEMVTEAKDFWGGETGFGTNDSDWLDGEGNPMDYPPDIQPYDWVYGWVDNGASAQVQLGEISGAVHLVDDFIEGTIYAPWFSEELAVDCHSWGAPLPEEILKYDTVFPDGEDTYLCSWAGEWDIQPSQDVGVGYSGPDGHWVANAILPPNPRIVASEAGDWFWVTEFYPGLLDLFIYESADEGATLLWSGQQEAADLWGITSVGFDVHGQDLLPGNFLVVSDGVNEKGLILETITVEVFDLENEIMAGTAPPGSEVWAAAGPMEWQERVLADVDPESGAWWVDFKTIGFDITEEMRPWSYAHIYDEDGDANEGSTPPPPLSVRAHPVWDSVDAWFWPQDATLHLSIDDPNTENVPDLEMDMPGDVDPNIGSVWFDFEGAYDLKPGDLVTVTDGATTHTLIVSILSIDDVDVDKDSASGTVEPGIEVRLPSPDNELYVTGDPDGNWFADFTQIGFDLTPGTMVIAEVFDEDGDNSSFEWYIPNPRFSVFPERDWFAAQDWPGEATVSITVEDKPECSLERESWGGFFDGTFPEDCNLEIGNTVAFVNDDTIRTHIVQNLAVTDVDADMGTVSGTVYAGAHLEVYVHEHDTSYMELIAKDGTWLADFGTIGFELLEGMCGAAQITDEVGNATVVDWCVP